MPRSEGSVVINLVKGGESVGGRENRVKGIEDEEKTA